MNNSTIQPIILNNIAIYPNVEGLFCLNDIAKAGGLTGKKANPSEWRTKISEYLKLTANLRATGNTHRAQTWGTEEAAIAYAMWVSIDFYMTVVRVFVAVRNDLHLAKQVNRELTKGKLSTEGKLSLAEQRANDTTFAALAANTKISKLQQRKRLSATDVLILLHSKHSAQTLNKFMVACGYAEYKGAWSGSKGYLVATEKGLNLGLVNQPCKFNTTQLKFTQEAVARFKAKKEMFESDLDKIKARVMAV